MSLASPCSLVPEWAPPRRPGHAGAYTEDATSGIYSVVPDRNAPLDAAEPPSALDEGSRATPRPGNALPENALLGDKRLGNMPPGKLPHGEMVGPPDDEPPQGGALDAPLSEVYRECAPAIHRMMLRLGIPERYAEDATNDVFVTALPRWDEFRGDSTRRTWLFGFALKVAANQRRKLGRAADDTALSTGHDFDASPSPDTDPFEQTSTRQALEQLQTLLDTLSLEERALWLLVHYEDVSVSDAAEIVGISAPKAYVLVKWVHAKLVKAWKRSNPPDAWRAW